jgi:NAD+ kinase
MTPIMPNPPPNPAPLAAVKPGPGTPAPGTTFERIAFVASDSSEAQAARRRLAHTYGSVPPAEAQAIVALGGDGLMLQTLHTYMHARIPIYGMNRGSVGFLMNEFGEDDLLARLAQAEMTCIHPLAMRALDAAGEVHEDLAINEVSMFRQTHQAAKLRITIDGKVRLEELICDGVLVATPAGSTAYNLSAYGPILPIDAPLLALTPISPFRPRRWRGALLPESAEIMVDVLEPGKRPVSAVADHAETRSVVRVTVQEARNIDLFMMFDPGHNLDERILSEQFRY